MNSIVSQGIIDAVKDDKITKPIVVRMKGTGSEDAAKVVSTLRHHLALIDMGLWASADHLFVTLFLCARNGSCKLPGSSLPSTTTLTPLPLTPSRLPTRAIFEPQAFTALSLHVGSILGNSHP